MKKEKVVIDDNVLVIKPRLSVPVPHRKLDNTVETVQGQEQKVSDLFQDYVLGRLDPSQLGGAVYDSDDAEEVDPFNTFGLTLEEATRIEDQGRQAHEDLKSKRKKEQEDRSKSERDKLKEDLRKEIEEEMKKSEDVKNE